MYQKKPSKKVTFNSKKKFEGSFCACTTRCATKVCLCKRDKRACSTLCQPNKTCCNIYVEKQKAETIDLTKVKTKPTEIKIWKIVGSTLYQYDKMVLQSADWLNDKLIHASEQLLKQQHPHIFGLQDPILQITSTLEIMGNKEFVQILHHGQNHWITISTVGCSSNTVHVYDTLNLPFTKDLEAIVADLLFTNNKAYQNPISAWNERLRAFYYCYCLCHMQWA